MNIFRLLTDAKEYKKQNPKAKAKSMLLAFIDFKQAFDTVD